MTRITQSDQIVQLLRQQLQRISDNKKTGKNGKAAIGAKKDSLANRVASIAAVESLPEKEAEKALLRLLLLENFGEAIDGDARFHSMVDRLHSIITSDSESRILLRNSLQMLGSE